MKMNLKGALTAIACLGMIAQPALANGPVTSARQTVPNVRLSDAGTLNGRTIDATGKPLTQQTVELRKSGQVVAKATTGENGTFSVPRVVPGAYVLAVGTKAAEVRVWETATGPPKSLSEAVRLAGDAPVRGQYCQNGCPPGACTCGSGGGFFGGLDVISLTTLGASVTAAVISGIALSEVNDANDKLDQIVSP